MAPAVHLLALDDYGTWYAEAAALLAIQPHLIKLDRALMPTLTGGLRSGR